ncbi:hypothetical protein OL67_002188 [Phaeobacter piscinae]|nr:hypothetical protein OL67_002188 [Phaeobacter piscinae]
MDQNFLKSVARIFFKKLDDQPQRYRLNCNTRLSVISMSSG